MIDLQARREENKKRLRGIDVDGKAVVPYTKADIDNPEVCWDIISLCVRLDTVKEANGRIKLTKKLKFPELLDTVVVGERKTKGNNAKRDKVERTNIDTMREMYTYRNAMNSHYEDDVDDKYIGYFKSVVEVLDAYAYEVVVDIITEDDDFLNRVNHARGCTKQA